MHSQESVSTGQNQSFDTSKNSTALFFPFGSRHSGSLIYCTIAEAAIDFCKNPLSLLC